MTKILYIGDMHIRGTSPRNRLDDYKEALKAKLREIFTIAQRENVCCILCAGDTFDRPEVSTGILIEFADLFLECPVPFLTTAGNHDLYSYNLATFQRTSLVLLERLVPQFRVINAPSNPVEVADNIQVTFTPFDTHIDREGYGYSPQAELGSGYFKIHVAHGMLLDHEPPFDRYTLVQDVKTTADLVLTGHDHIGYGFYKRPDGKTFLNCGSITRLSASASEVERTIQVALITVENRECDIQLIPLQTAKPGIEILDRSHIEAEQKRQYAMENFSALIQADSGEKVLLDIDSIVETIAEKEQMAPAVVRIALDKINMQRMAL